MRCDSPLQLPKIFLHAIHNGLHISCVVHAKSEANLHDCAIFFPTNQHWRRVSGKVATSGPDSLRERRYQGLSISSWASFFAV